MATMTRSDDAPARSVRGSPLAKAAGLANALLDAFVDTIAPVLARSSAGVGWLAECDGDGIVLSRVSRGVPTAIGRLGELADRQDRLARRLDRSSGELRLAPANVVLRTVQLPPASRDFIAPLIAHRLERLIPWSPDQAVYGFRIAEPKAADGAMSVELAAASRRTVEMALERLRELGLHPRHVTAPARPGGEPIRIDRGDERSDPSRVRLRRRVAIGLTVLAAVLVPGFLASSWLVWSSERQLAAIEARITRARAGLPVAGGGGAGDRLIAAKRPEQSIAVLLDRISAALPSDSHLRELEVDDQRIRMLGRSADAPSLIETLETNAALKGRFAAPVTRDDDRQDNFEIVAARPGQPGADKP